MSATVAAALKKLAVAVLTDKKTRKVVIGIVLGVLVLLVMPIVAAVSVFSGMIEIDTDRLQQMVVENLSLEEIAMLQEVEDTMAAIEEEVTDAGFEDRVKEAQIVYILALSDRADESDFVTRLAECFEEEQSYEEFIDAVNETFDTEIEAAEFEAAMQTT